jgi:hypothetical protein
VGVPGFVSEEVAQVSDEQKIEEELDSEDDVEAHKKGGVHLNEEASNDDDDGDVEAHMKVHQK